MIKQLKICIWIFVFFLIFSSCKKEEEIPDDVILKEKVYDIMHYWYLWNDKVPENIDLGQYSSGEAVMNTLKYKAIDRWSSVSKAVDYEQYYNEGQYVGTGFGMTWDERRNLMVSYVFKNSPAYSKGIKRGWEILEINGIDVKSIADWSYVLGDDVAGVQVNLKLQDTSKTVHNITLTKELISMNTVLHKDVLSSGDKKIGYLVFKTFISTSEAELEEAFNLFETHNISELILDLRYNGGGQINIAKYLAEKIAPQSANGKTFIEYKHNAARNTKDNSKMIEKNGNLSLNRLIVLTAGGTASSSELLINGLKPYMDVKLIGKITYGKPVGSYGWKEGDYVISPICFRVVNANGVGDYYGGLEPDAYCTDGLDKEFGDKNENFLAEALFYIENGHFSQNIVAKKTLHADIENRKMKESFNGFRRELNSY